MASTQTICRSENGLNVSFSFLVHTKRTKRTELQVWTHPKRTKRHKINVISSSNVQKGYKNCASTNCLRTISWMWLLNHIHSVQFTQLILFITKLLFSVFAIDQVKCGGHCHTWSRSSVPSAGLTSPHTGSRRKVAASSVSSAWRPIRRRPWRPSTPIGWRTLSLRLCSKNRSVWVFILLLVVELSWYQNFCSQ